MDKVPMTKEDKEYFKDKVRTLCGTEVLQIREIINDLGAKRIFTKEDLNFMNKELGRQAGAVFGHILRALEAGNHKEAQRVLTGGKEK